MTGELPASGDVAAHVSTAYGVAVGQAVTIPGGLVHPAWRLSVPGGAWFCKWYRGKAWAHDRLAAVLMAQTVAADAGLPSARPFADRQGRPLSPWRGGLLVCSQYLSGITPPPGTINAAMAHTLGAALGRLHLALSALPAGEPRVPDAAAIEVRCRELLALCESWRNPTAGDRLAAESLRYRLQALKAQGVDQGTYAACRWQVCHGDYFPANLLFDGDRLTGIVDFDFTGPRWRSLELARAAVEAAWLEDRGIAPALYQAVLAGYQSTCPQSAAELRAGPRLWWEYLLHSLYPIPERYGDPADLPQHWMALLRRRHDLMIWLGENLAPLQALSAL